MMTYQEIAAELGISFQAVWEAEQRALAKVRKILRQRGISWDTFEL